MPLWPEEARNKVCKKQTRIQAKRSECQAKCLQDAKCVGINYSDKSDLDRPCGICKNSDLEKANDGFSFHRRSGKILGDGFEVFFSKLNCGIYATSEFVFQTENI